MGARYVVRAIFFQLMAICLVQSLTIVSTPEQLYFNTPNALYGPRQFDVQAALVLTDPADACAPISNDISGRIVLVQTAGDIAACDYGDQIDNVQKAGGIAIIISEKPYHPSAGSSAYVYPASAAKLKLTIPILFITATDLDIIREMIGNSSDLVYGHVTPGGSNWYRDNIYDAPGMLAIDAAAGGLALANTIYATLKFFQFKTAGHPFKSVPILTLGILIVASIAGLITYICDILYYSLHVLIVQEGTNYLVIMPMITMGAAPTMVMLYWHALVSKVQPRKLVRRALKITPIIMLVFLIVGVAGAILIAAQRIVVALLAAVLLVVIVTYLLYGFRLVKQLNSSECVNSKERHKLTKKMATLILLVGFFLTALLIFGAIWVVTAFVKGKPSIILLNFYSHNLCLVFTAAVVTVQISFFQPDSQNSCEKSRHVQFQSQSMEKTTSVDPQSPRGDVEEA